MRTNALLSVAASVALTLPLTSGVLRAQTQTGASERVTFDVASVKVDTSGQMGGAGDRLPKNGRWRWTRISLQALVMYAYDVSRSQVFGIPKSMEGPEAAFNIDATLPLNTPPARFRLMMQSLLADRFHFAMHREDREIPVIMIDVAKGGSKLKEPSGNCVDHPTMSPPDQYPCGQVLTMPRGDAQQRVTWEYAGRSVSMADLVSALSWMDGPVFDNTGIQGLFDFDVKYQLPLISNSADADTRMNAQMDNARERRNAFEQQAGLMVGFGQPKKHPMPAIVIDHLEMPTPN